MLNVRASCAETFSDDNMPIIIMADIVMKQVTNDLRIMIFKYYSKWLKVIFKYSADISRQLPLFWKYCYCVGRQISLGIFANIHNYLLFTIFFDLNQLNFITICHYFLYFSLIFRKITYAFISLQYPILSILSNKFHTSKYHIH